MARGIAAGRRPAAHLLRRRRRAPRPGAPPRAPLNATTLADALGTDDETLLQRLRSGEDPRDLLGRPSATAGDGSPAGAALRGGVAVDRYA